MMRDVRALSNRCCERIVLERAEDADLEQVRCGLCAQRVSKHADSNNPRKGHISGVKVRWAKQTGSLGYPPEIRTGNLDLD